MTIKDFYEEAKSMGKEDYEMVTIEMVKDRKCRWIKVTPRYGISEKVVFMEIGGVVAE